jgi:metallophosphoesterase superfamily enzyme
VTVILPDMQIGYYRGPDGNLEATHDEAAMAIALQVVRDAKPSRVVMVGDNLDLPELGKYRYSPAFAMTTQATIDRGGLMAAEVRAAAPDADIIWLAGNHEERLPNYILDNAKASFGIKQAMEPEGWPVLSVPHLCRLDDYGVSYRPGYPAADYWITEKLRVIHGDRVQSRGSTAHKYLNDEKTSVIYGHIHRIERAHKTRTDWDGPREIMAASPGCLARIDGAVPSTKGGMDLDGRPIIGIHEDWQQGVAVVLSSPETGDFDYEQIRIFGGRGIWRGKIYEAGAAGA